MTQRDIIIDQTQQRVIAGLTDTSVAALPAFIRGDTIKFKLFVVSSSGRISVPTRTPTAGQTVEMALGFRGGTTLTSQFTWTASEDLADPYWEASLPMNTDPIIAAMAGKTSVGVTLDVKLVEDGTPTTILLADTTIQSGVINPGDVVIPPGMTPIFAETAPYLNPTGFQGKIRLMSPDGTKQGDVYWGDDNTLHGDSVT